MTTARADAKEKTLEESNPRRDIIGNILYDHSVLVLSFHHYKKYLR